MTGRVYVPPVLVIFLLAASVHAQSGASGAREAVAARTESAAEAGPQPTAKPVAWQPEWHRFRAWEYATSAATLATGFGLYFHGPEPPPERHASELENDIADALAVRGGAADPLRAAGDLAYLGTIVYRFVDSALIPSIYWGNGDVAWQMTMLDVQALSLVAAVVWGAQSFIGRERPRFRDCPGEAPEKTSCSDFGSDRYRSFISGHFAVALAGANLTCLHHARMGLYGGGTADDVACGTHMALALTVAVSRLTVEEHYLSDTLLGGALGVFAGYVVPSALHYGFGSDEVTQMDPERTQSESSPVRVMLLPRVGHSEWGVNAVGRF